MPRKKVTQKWDDRIKPALDRMAAKSGISCTALVEQILIQSAIVAGELPQGTERLPETRGGKKHG